MLIGAKNIETWLDYAHLPAVGIRRRLDKISRIESELVGHEPREKD